MTNSKIKTLLKKSALGSTQGSHTIIIYIDANFVQSETRSRFNNQANNAAETSSTFADESNEVINDLIRSAFEESILENKLTPASAPSIELISKDNSDEYVFTATFDIVPDVDLSDLSNIKVNIPTVEVTDVDIKSTIDAIFQQHPSKEAALAALNIKEADISTLESEIRLNLQREAALYESEIKKRAVLSSLSNALKIDVPSSMVKSEVDRLKSDTNESENAPQTQHELTIMATNNILRRVIINAIVQKTHLSLHPHMVRERVTQAATAYENPEEVVQWYYSNRIELAGIEALLIEDLVIDWAIKACNKSSYTTSFTEASALLSQQQ